MRITNIGIIGYGFIGKSLVENLSKKKNISIKIIDRNEKPINFNHFWQKGDYRNSDLIRDFVKDLDVLYHLASSTVPCSIIDSPKDELDENIISMLKLLDIIIKNNPDLYFIFSSSASVYGNQEVFPISENNTTNPISFHGLQKLTIEHYLRIFNLMHNLKYAALRISNPYGQGQKKNTLQGLISIIKNSIINKNSINIYGLHECSRDFIHITDLANAITSLININPINNVINISSNQEVKIYDLINLVENITGETLNANYLKLRSSDIKRSVLDNSFLRSITNWEPKIKLDTGINNFINN
tara:strand:- start:2 stop:904 length:903 start_codon:yes stop_codon:yes gene_type:complete